MKYFIGIDFSINSPSITIQSEEITKIFWLTSTKKFQTSIKEDRYRLMGIEANTDRNDTYRFYENNKALIYFIKGCSEPEQTSIALEGYSYGSVNMAFRIAEATGLLKHMLFQRGYSFTVVPPQTMKKFATGSGRAEKSKIYETFLEKTNLNLEKLLNGSRKNSPISDIADSFFLSEYAKKIAD